MTRLNSRHVMCLAVALALCSQAEAQTNEVHDSLSLHEVSIVGKSKARKMHEQAYAVSVVDLATKYQTASPLNKVLNTVTSVNIREDGGLGSNYSFSMKISAQFQYVKGQYFEFRGDDDVWQHGRPH